MRALALFALLAVACTDTENSTVPVEPGDATDFGQWVQPVIRQQCASLDCHGVPGRPLRLYALHGLRLTADLRGADESAEELAANALAFAGVAPAAPPHESLLLLKPLSNDAGGFEHVGGDLFTDRDAPGYRCLLAWLQGELPGQAEGSSACITAAEPLF